MLHILKANGTERVLTVRERIALACDDLIESLEVAAESPERTTAAEDVNLYMELSILREHARKCRVMAAGERERKGEVRP